MTDLIEPRPMATDEVTLVELPARRAAVVRIEGAATDLPRLMGGAFEATAAAIGAAGAEFAGPPFARYHAFGAGITADAGFPFVGELEPSGDVVIVELPAGRAVTTRHVGSYDTIAAAWDRANAWMRDHGLVPTGAPWEGYLTGPEDPGPPVTEIVFPVP
jgi:effector-binding domain-containing protein